MKTPAWKRPPTAGQLETLALLFKGLTEREVAAARHRAPCSIERAVQALKDKADNPRNVRELIYEGLARGWIEASKC